MTPRTMLLTIVAMGVAHLAFAQSSVNYDWEDGQMHGDPTSMKVKPKILDQGGNSVLRITGNYGDNDSIPSSFPHRVRATVTLTNHFSSMPLLTPANMRQTYSADMRISAKCPNGCSVFELFQSAPGGEGSYGDQNGTGPSARFTVVNGRTKFETRYKNEKKVDVYDLGVSAASWHEYTLVAVWSHDPSVGRFDIYVDGVKKKTISGRDVNMGPATNRLPLVKLGMYGDHAVGTVDVDNIVVGRDDDGSGPPPNDTPPVEPPPPPPPPPLPPPIVFRPPPPAPGVPAPSGPSYVSQHP